jgi:hypothetical protein
MIKESRGDIGEALIFDKWCYLGKYSEYAYEDSGDTIAVSDFDVYKILNSFLKNERNMKKITTLSQEALKSYAF